MLLHLPRKVVPLVAIKLNLDDVVSIYQRLLQQVNEQADYELSRLKRQDNQTEEAFQDYIKRARDQAFKITITVTGRDGQSLTGEDATIFHSPNRPDKVASIYLTNATAYQAFAGVRPLNSFDLYLDF
ncbi:MAG TPA: hypothetical protein VEU06_05885, partial [Micropepsaceae bacterium]|nr:hypothetical protein [Micropepsaceae bacterium]